MRAISPNIGSLEFILGEEQLQYHALPAAQHPGVLGVEMVTRWAFTPDERRAIAEGEDLYLRHLTFGHPFQPIAPSVGWAP